MCKWLSVNACLAHGKSSVCSSTTLWAEMYAPKIRMLKP